MQQVIRTTTPQTLKEYNEGRFFAINIITGKEFRRLKRKRKNN